MVCTVFYINFLYFKACSGFLGHFFKALLYNFFYFHISLTKIKSFLNNRIVKYNQNKKEETR